MMAARRSPYHPKPDSDAEARAAMALVEVVRPLFAGKSADVQGAALADLLAMWLAGHVMQGDQKATDRLRRRMLEHHLEAVRSLISVNYKMLIEPELKRRQH
jgi:hypothetical protein